MTKFALLSSIVLTLAAGSHARALNLTFEKALEAEFARCAPVLPIRDVHQFALQIEYGFLSEDEIKKTFGDETFTKFARLVEIVRPYLTSLDERGEIMDLTGKDELTVSCAKFAKGVLITPYQRLVADLVRNALDQQKKAQTK